MANSNNNLFAPPTEEELYAPPKKPVAPKEAADLYAPPEQEDLYAPPAATEVPMSSEYEKLHAETERDSGKGIIGGIVSNIKQSPGFVSKRTGQEDVETIAKQKGVDPAELGRLASFYGAAAYGEPGDVGEIGKELVGAVSRGPLLGIPQWVVKKLHSDPKMREAIDELRELTDKRRSLLGGVTENIIPVTAGGKAAQETIAAGKAATAGSRLATVGKAAGAGAAAGLSGSREGQEAEGAAIGGLFGGVLGGAAEGVAAAASRKARKAAVTQAERELIEQAPRLQEQDIARVTEEVASKTRDSEEAIEKALLGNGALSQEQVNKIVEQQFPEEQVARALNPDTPEGAAMRAAAEAERSKLGGGSIEDITKRKMAEEILEKRAIDFAETITNKKVNTYEEALNALDSTPEYKAEGLKSAYKDFVKAEQGLRGIRDASLRVFNQEGVFGRMANAVSGNQHVLMHIDNKAGVGARQAGADLSAAISRKSYPQQEFVGRLSQIYSSGSGKVNKLLSNGQELIKHYEKYGTEGLSPELAKSMSQIKKLNDDFYSFVSKQAKSGDKTIAEALNPKYRENFLHSVTKDTADVVVLLNSRLRQATRDAAKQTGREVSRLSELSEQELAQLVRNSKPAAELLEAVQAFRPETPIRPQSFANEIEEMIYTRPGNQGVETAARTLEERGGKIPDFLREDNIWKAQLKYMSNTLNHMYMRQPIARLNKIEKQLRALGAETDADFVHNMVRDTLYTRPNSIASGVQSMRVAYGKLLNQLEESHGKYAPDTLAVRLAGNLASGLASMKSNIYYNMLGWFSVRSAIQNSAGAIATTLPELGPKYGVSAVGRGAVYTATNFKRLIEKAKQIGATPRDVVHNAEELLAEGFRATLPVRTTSRAIKKLAQAGMVFYQGVERANRALMLGIGEVIAHDLQRGSASALQALKRFPPDLRRNILQNAESPTITSELIGKHLNNVTQFNYNKSEMAEVARIMGPLAVFSKWPTEMMGKAIYNIRNEGLVKGGIRNFEYFLTSYLLLEGIDTAIQQAYNKKPGEMSERQQKFLGKEGLSQSAPLGSLQSVGTGEIFTPPVVDIIWQDLVDPIKKKQDPKMKHLVGSLVEKYAPGAGAIRFVTDDMVTYATGHKPQGADFFEKTAEGARQIKKGLK